MARFSNNYLLMASTDPVMKWIWSWVGWCSLIVTLRIGIYHDQLHYDDVMKQASGFKK